MAAGKNKLQRFCRCYIGGKDISGDARTIGTLNYGVTERDMTSWLDDHENFMAEARMIWGITGYEAYVNDDTGRSWEALKDNQEAKDVLFAIGGGGAPDYGDLCYMLPGIQIANPVSFPDGMGIVAADFRFDPADISPHIKRPFGKIQHPLGSISTNLSGTTVDWGASSTGGAWAMVQVTASAAGNFSLRVEHSSNGTDWATLMTFAGTWSAAGTAIATATGTINRYTRFATTRTAGTISAVCGLARNYA